MQLVTAFTFEYCTRYHGRLVPLHVCLSEQEQVVLFSIVTVPPFPLRLSRASQLMKDKVRWMFEELATSFQRTLQQREAQCAAGTAVEVLGKPFAYFLAQKYVAPGASPGIERTKAQPLPKPNKAHKTTVAHRRCAPTAISCLMAYQKGTTCTQ